MSDNLTFNIGRIVDCLNRNILGIAILIAICLWFVAYSINQQTKAINELNETIKKINLVVRY